MSIPFTWIYLIYDPYTRYYKIGKSDNPDVRLKQLRNPSSYGTIPAAPTNYALIEAWLCPAETENELHAAYAEVRIHGEWFDLESLFADGIAPPIFAVQECLESNWFRENRRWIAEFTRFDEDYHALLDDYESLCRKHQTLKGLIPQQQRKLLKTALVEVLH